MVWPRFVCRIFFRGEYMYINTAYVTQTPYHCTNSIPYNMQSFHCDMKQEKYGISYRPLLNVYGLWMILRKVLRLGRARCACLGRVCYAPSKCKVWLGDFK